MKNGSKKVFVAELLLLILIGGCQKVSVQPIDFSRDDEFIREGDFMVLADRRVFTVMAFLNAFGFDDEANGKSMHPVRLRVRSLVNSAVAGHPEKVRQWKQFYEKHRYGMFVYQDYVLSLSSDYPFRRVRPDSEVGYKWFLRGLDRLPEIMNDFWETVELEKIWTEVKPFYLAEIQKYDIQGMNNDLACLYNYLRMPRKDSYIIVHVPDLLDQHYHAIGAAYDNHFYSVESPGSYNYRLQVHEYLHSIVNDLVKSNYAPYADKLNTYYRAGKNKPMAKTYQERVCFTSECLIRALDSRLSESMSDIPSEQRKFSVSNVRELSKQGLNLTEPFFYLLTEYENQPLPFDEFVPLMFEKLAEYE